MDILLTILLKVCLPIFGVVVGIYKDEIFQFLFGTWRYKYLRGIWVSHWNEDPSIKYPNGRSLQSENVEIKHVFGKIVSGSGDAVPYGKYNFKGYISESGIAFRYSGLRRKSNTLPGVLILRLDNNKDTLSGFWAQNKPEEVVHGSTKWEKVDENAL